MEYTDTITRLMEVAAKELLDEIAKSENLDCSHLKQKAADFYIKSKEHVQIQILVVRNEDDFLEDFQTEEMRQHKPKTKEA